MKQQQKGQVVMVQAAVGWLLPSEVKPNSWTDKFDRGAARSVLYVEERPSRNSYRVLVASRGSRPDERQWLDATSIPDVIRTLQDADKAYRKARRKLEGGLIRRILNAVF